MPHACWPPLAQFPVCGFLQICVDVSIIYQVFKYAGVSHKVRHHVAHLSSKAKPSPLPTTSHSA